MLSRASLNQRFPSTCCPNGGLRHNANVKHHARRAPTCEATQHHVDAVCLTSRRQALLSAATILGTSALTWPSLADASFSSFDDAVDHFKIDVPSGWEFGADQTPANNTPGSRRTLAWYPRDAGGPRETNVTVVITNVSGEYTRLGSFGSAIAFGTNMVNSMDRSFLLRAPEWARGKEPIQVARLLEAEERNGHYFIEYFVDNPTEGKKHLLSLVSLGFNGRYNRLYTLTAQCYEKDLASFRPTLDRMLTSFVPPHLA